MNGIMLAAIIMITSIASAQSASEKGTDDKLDLKKLEQKYWSAKDDDFSVIQNRAYTKAKRWYINAGGGLPINDPYGKGSLTQLGTGYYFSERFGLEYSYTSANISDNEATTAFINEHGTTPNHNILKSMHSISAAYVPFYAKMSFLDRSIIYFDMGFSLGLGMTNYDQVANTGNRSQSAANYSLNINQTFFFSEKFALRVDYKNTWTTEEKLRYAIGTDPESKRSIGNSSNNDSNLIFSVVYWH